MQNNPYVLTFGKEPSVMIPRLAQTRELIESFMEDKPSQQICLITGVRGCGKTVFMSSISREIASDNHWIAVELNPERDLLVSLAAKLNSQNYLASIFKTAKINLSFLGIGLEVSGSTPLTDIESALIQMLEIIQKHNKKVLITRVDGHAVLVKENVLKLIGLNAKSHIDGGETNPGYLTDIADKPTE